MDSATEVVLIIIFSALLLAGLGEPLYYRYIAPRFIMKVIVLDKGFTTGVRPVRIKGGPGANLCNCYWGEFQVVETGEIIKLGMGLELYTELKKGHRGMLTYRKGYALAFQRSGYVKKRKPFFDEKLIEFFSRKNKR